MSKKVGVHTCYIQKDNQIKAVSAVSDDVYKFAKNYAATSSRLQTLKEPHFSVTPDTVPQEYLVGFLDALDLLEQELLKSFIIQPGAVSGGKTLLQAYQILILKKINKMQGFDVE